MGIRENENSTINYKLIDLLKFICAFLVIGIHTRPFQANCELLDMLFYYDISNYAVPFFYACTGYFIVIKSTKENIHILLLNHCKKILKMYLKWSAIYLPLTLSGWIIEGGMSYKYLIYSLRNFIFIGENFYSWTLWYLNGLIFALIFIDVLLRKFSIKKIATIGLFVYLFGIGLTLLNSYSSYLPIIISKPIKLYFSIFVTTRNGLFKSLPFISVGMVVAEKNCIDKIELSKKNCLLIAFIYLAKVGFSLMGGGAQYISEILDLPIFYFMFELIICACKKMYLKGEFYKQLRDISEIIYLVHMYFVALCALVLYNNDYHNFKSYVICVFGAAIIACLFQMKKYEN